MQGNGYIGHALIRLSFFAALLIVLSACGGLSSEPKTVATLPPPTAAPAVARVPDVGYPVTPPDLKQGAQIFSARCTTCHGVGGKGNGQLVGTGQVPFPGDFTLPGTAGKQTPLNWFQTITNGRLKTLMPPWGRELSESDRWAVAMYTYTLAYKPEQLTEGQKLAAGTSEIATRAREIADELAEPTKLVAVSDEALEARLNVGGATPEQRRALVAYLRTNALMNLKSAPGGLSQPAAAAPAPTSAGSDSASKSGDVTGSVIGRITNGTPGGTTPATQAVELHIVDQDSKETVLKATADADGKFTFKDVPMRADRGYVVTTTYLDRTFATDFIPGDPATSTLNLPLKLYELTNDPAVISITSMTTQVAASADSLQIAQVFRLQNNSNRLFTLDKLSNGEYGSVTLSLPHGASIMGFSDGNDRFVVAPDGTSFTDTMPVVPGTEHTVHVIYSLPYRETGIMLEQPVDYPMTGPLQVNVSPESISATVTTSVSSQPLPSRGTQSSGSLTFRTWSGDVALKVGNTVRIEMRGKPAPVDGSTDNAAAAPVSGGISRDLIVGLLIGGGFGLLGVGGFFLIRERMAMRQGGMSTLRQVNPETQHQMDDLVRQIAHLDDMHAQGKISDSAHARRRRKLKEQLSALMKT